LVFVEQKKNSTPNKGPEMENEMYTEVNGIRFHYRIDGRKGTSWVTFVTGIANDLTMWDGQVAALEKDFQILRFDLRGHGGTDATEPDYTFEMLIGDILGLWGVLGIDKSHLVGLGLGGAIAIGLAIDHSDRLISLVPCCCRAVMTPDFAAIWPRFVETVKQFGMEGMVEPTVQRWFTDDFKSANPTILDKIRQMIRSTNPLGYYGCIAAFLTLNFRDRISRVSVPTLFISGADDHLGGPPEIMQQLADAVPSAKHVSVPRAGHICNIQNQEVFNSILSAFLRGQKILEPQGDK
jgi:3-oxoadipate enol-lactonase